MSPVSHDYGIVGKILPINEPSHRFHVFFVREGRREVSSCNPFVSEIRYMYDQGTTQKNNENKVANHFDDRYGQEGVAQCLAPGPLWQNRGPEKVAGIRRVLCFGPWACLSRFLIIWSKEYLSFSAGVLCLYIARGTFFIIDWHVYQISKKNMFLLPPPGSCPLTTSVGQDRDNLPRGEFFRETLTLTSVAQDPRTIPRD